MHCTILLSAHSCAIAIDHAEPESEFQVEQVQGACGGPQVPSVVDANMAFGSRQVLVHLTTILELILFFCILIMILVCALGYRS
jgi:hypothetical protein